MAAPAFSRRHYTIVALIFSELAGAVIRCELTEADETWRAFRDAFVDVFQEDNPRFDGDRFRAALVPLLDVDDEA